MAKPKRSAQPKWQIEALDNHDLAVRQQCLHEAVTNSMSGSNPSEVITAAAKYYDFVTGKQPKKRK